ncbi:D-TA family PLP-dependent enzyme [Verrucomicrobiales bacterium]|nr:D-TA family PLP-dependent enzyme [Verrucomicrobiales bacterium]
MIAGIQSVPSPGLIVFPDRVHANITRMIQMAGSPDRLRPHLKTAKMPEIVALYLDAGIYQFKCATLSEMRMALLAGAKDVLLAYQPLGPNVAKFASLAKEHPKTKLSSVVDHSSAVERLAETEAAVGIYIDIDCGMHRTGIPAGDKAMKLADAIRQTNNLKFEGWHVYDGHLHQTDLADRHAATRQAWAPFWKMLQSTSEASTIIAGGTPTFPVHANDPRVICSPGTTIFWDAGYAHKVPDMPFEQAAMVLTRVISKPGKDLLTLDLGHKAISAENPIEHRIVFPAIPNAVFVSQSEEHLVVQSPEASEFALGDTLLGVPWHICPTVALYDHATTIVDNTVNNQWAIPARQRI